MKNTIKVILIKQNSEPKLIKIENSLEEMQRIVGGFIEMVMPFEDDIAIVCNDMGKCMGLPFNRKIKNDYIAGDFFLCYAPIDSEDFESVPDQLIQKYINKFKL